MQYKTMVLGLLEQRPQLHEQLRQNRKLLSTMEELAQKLKLQHEFWLEAISKANLVSHPLQRSSAAMEMAMKELEDSLAAGLPEEAAEIFSLEDAIAFLRLRSSVD